MSFRGNLCVFLCYTAIANDTQYNVTDNLGRVVYNGTLKECTIVELKILPNMTHTVLTSNPAVVSMASQSYTSNVNETKYVDTFLMHFFPMEQMASSYVFATMSNALGDLNIHFVMVISRMSDIQNLTLNGNSLDESVMFRNWTNYYNSIYSTATLLLPPAPAFYNLTNNAGNNIAVYVVENNFGESSGYRVPPLYEETPSTETGVYTCVYTNHVHIYKRALKHHLFLLAHPGIQ